MLRRDKTEARKMFYRLMAEDKTPAARSAVSARKLCDRYDARAGAAHPLRIPARFRDGSAAAGRAGRGRRPLPQNHPPGLQSRLQSVGRPASGGGEGGRLTVPAPDTSAPAAARAFASSGRHRPPRLWEYGCNDGMTCRRRWSGPRRGGASVVPDYGPGTRLDLFLIRPPDPFSHRAGSLRRQHGGERVARVECGSTRHRRSRASRSAGRTSPLPRRPGRPPRW